MPFYVNVPDAPGVPNVAFAPGFAASASTSLMTADAPGLIAVFSGPQWGIFDTTGFSPVIVADTITGVDFKQDWIVCDYPVEEGVFETYDKVSEPFDVRMRFVAGGSLTNRQALLDSVAAIAGDLNLYTAVTPEAVYENVNVRHFDYRRTTANGVGIIVVDVFFTEVRVIVATETSTLSMQNTASPSSTSSVNGGTVQPTAPTASQSNIPAYVSPSGKSSVGFQ